jgi:hypothetical protein
VQWDTSLGFITTFNSLHSAVKAESALKGALDKLSIPSKAYSALRISGWATALKRLSHEIDFKNIHKN